MKVEIKVIGSDEIRAKLAAVSSDKWPKILSNAATETAFYVRNKVRKEMPRYIDRPKPFTLNSIYVNKGTGKTVDASVEWRKPSGGNSGGRYLRPTVEGGKRHLTGFEKKLISLRVMDASMRAVPTKAAPLDSYGNVAVGFLKKLSQALEFNPFGSAYGKSKRKSVSRSVLGLQQSTTVADNVTYFAVKTKEGNRLGPGIYERRRSGLGALVRKLFIFTSKVNYKKTFPFYDLATKASQDKFSEKLDESISKALNGERL